MADIIDLEEYKKEKQLVHITVDITLDDQATILAIQRKHGETDEQLRKRIEKATLIDKIFE